MEPEKKNDTWSDLQALKLKQNRFKEKRQRRKKELEEIVSGISSSNSHTLHHPSSSTSQISSSSSSTNLPHHHHHSLSSTVTNSQAFESHRDTGHPHDSSATPTISTIDAEEVENKLLSCLCDAALKLPVDSRCLLAAIRKFITLEKSDHLMIVNLLEKFAHQGLITTIKDSLTSDGETCIIVSSADHSKLIQFAQEAVVNADSPNRTDLEESSGGLTSGSNFKRVISDRSLSEKPSKLIKLSADNQESENGIEVEEVNLESLLSLESTKEKESKKMGEELLQLLSRPTAKERNLVERFQSVDGAQVQEFCAQGTKKECIRVSESNEPCGKLHFKKIIQKHTDEQLGDCSFLNTCFHMDTCKYVHYQVDYSTVKSKTKTRKEILTPQRFKYILYPPQWLKCDLRFFDMTILGKFAVIMADPPWDIHMELPYGTLSDDEMRKLNIPSLQDDGLIFLWVTGRAMELGRECLKLWGYERCDEIIWVKTNQLQRIIRTGRTGHWLNHGKEHCLVGIKGQPKGINRGLDCDVIVAEVRATSHKPDEIYGIIERLSPGTRKIELFGRPHNVQPNWITLGNQLDGVQLIDPELIGAYKRRYQNGDCNLLVPN